MSNEAMKRLTRDDTEHGIEYYRADEVDAMLAAAPQPAPAITPEHLLALAQTASLELDKVIEAFKMAEQREVKDVVIDSMGDPFIAKAYVTPQPAQQEPVAWLDGPHLVMRSDWRDRANYKGPWVDFGRAIPDSWVPVLYTSPPPQPERVRELECVIADLKAECQAIRAKQPTTEDSSAAQPAPVPEGWKLVPYALTPEMSHMVETEMEGRDFADFWRDLLNSAPVPAPVQQEPVGRTDRQIVDETEKLAAWLLSWSFNLQPESKTPMRESTHPLAKSCWAAACHIQEMLTATDPENAVAELEGDAGDHDAQVRAQAPAVAGIEQRGAA